MNHCEDADYPEILGFSGSVGDFKLAVYLNGERSPIYRFNVPREALGVFYNQRTGQPLEKICIDDWLFTVLNYQFNFEKKSVKIKAYHPDYVGQ